MEGQQKPGTHTGQEVAVSSVSIAACKPMRNERGRPESFE